MPFTGPIEDRLAIRELLDSYSDAVNRRDPQAWGALWAEDAQWSIPELPGFGTLSGRDTIVAAWEQAITGFQNLVFEATPGDLRIEGSRATMRSYTSESFYDPQDKINRTDKGVYDDALHKVDGNWLFTNRVFRRLHRG